jgi:hypothetical protein
MPEEVVLERGREGERERGREGERERGREGERERGCEREIPVLLYDMHAHTHSPTSPFV